MNVRLHFFRDRKSNINIKRIYEFFDEDIFKYSQQDKYIAFKYVHPQLNIKATFAFVKHNVIKEIYTLSTAYTNLNFFVEFPLIQSDYFLNDILSVVERMVKRFGLFYYIDIKKDIELFVRKEIFDTILDYRDRIVSIDELTRSREKLITPSKRLFEICEYQRQVPGLAKYFHGQVDVPEYKFYRHLPSDGFVSTVVWNQGKPTVFPKHVDYVEIIFPESTLPTFVPAVVAFDKIHRFLALLPEFVDTTRILKPGTQTKKAQKFLEGLKAHAVSDLEFEVIMLTNVMDERNQGFE
jgi:hypothetical protein